MLLFACLLVAGAAEVSHVTLNNGVQLPMLGLQPEKYPVEQIEGIVKMALQTGINYIDAGAFNQTKLSVGAALNGVERQSYFLASTIMLDANISGSLSYDAATASLESTLNALRAQYVDLMILSRPAKSCSAVQEQWRALEDFYAAGKARAIGLQVFCPSSLKCLMQTAKAAPALNQIFVHVGMGPDPEGFISAFNSSGVVTQSIRALDSGNPELISGKLVSGIGKAHGWSGAQVSMRWILDHGLPFAMPMSKQSHMEEALAIFQDHLNQDEMTELDHASSPEDSPSFHWCSEIEPVIV